MTTSDKTLERMRHNPRDWRIEDVLTVAKYYKLLMRTKGGSHHIFGFPGVKESVSVSGTQTDKTRIYQAICRAYRQD